MIEPTRFTSPDFNQVFGEVEATFVDELEKLVISRLIENKTVKLPGAEDEVLEYAGRTNFKIRIKRPHKNVWSIPYKSLREAIRSVLRRGKLLPVVEKANKRSEERELALPWLLHILPEEEYYRRSFVGNKVVHPSLGEGEVEEITDTGNVKVKFSDRVAMLKPSFVKLKAG